MEKIKVKLAPRWISPFGAAAQNGKNIDLIKKMSRNKQSVMFGYTETVTIVGLVVFLF